MALDSAAVAPPHRVLLTFDDGPVSVSTNSILDTLTRYCVKAIFFVLGKQLEVPANAGMLERIAAEGHIVGNHGYAHGDLLSMSDEEVRCDLERTEALIGGLKRGVKLWRPPFGRCDERVERVIDALGYRQMRWNVDSRDWSSEVLPDSWAARIVKQVQARQRGGFRNSVCLFHDSLPATAAALPSLLEALHANPNIRIARYAPWSHDGLRLPDQPDETEIPVCPPDAIAVRIGRSQIAARPGFNKLYFLNESGSLLWDSFREGADVKQASTRLANHYGIPEFVAQNDVEAALASWRHYALLGPTPPELEDPGPWPQVSEILESRGDKHFAVEHGYRFLGRDFRVRFETAELARAIHPRFGNLAASNPVAVRCAPVFEVSKVADRYVFKRPDCAGGSFASPTGVAYQLFFEIVKLCHPDLDSMACLHASSVSSSRSTIAFIGQNGSGKSTLAAALGLAGLSVQSDDRLFLDAKTRRPAATPNIVRLKRGSWAPVATRYPSVYQLPSIQDDEEEIRIMSPPAATEPLLPPVSHIFFPRFRAGCDTIARPITPGEAIQKIASSEGWISSDPVKFSCFARWIQEVSPFELSYSNLDEALERILNCVGQ
jgi:peptidoglycan/xylan/chitin deacetylase (PgdA/CDA1 family)/energy-coupling factor transporter ATP-binding protein EcfA2